MITIRNFLAFPFVVLSVLGLALGAYISGGKSNVDRVLGALTALNN